MTFRRSIKQMRTGSDTA